MMTPPGVCPGCGGRRRPECDTCAKCRDAGKSASPAVNTITLTAPTTLGRLRCRDHHEQTVRVNGKGCTICATDRATAARPQKKPRPQVQTYELT